MNWNNLLVSLLVAAGAVVAFALTWLAIRYSAYITERVDNEKIEGILIRLGDFVFRVVSELNQTVVEKLKTDGKWNSAEGDAVRALAISKIKTYLGPNGVKEAMVILGLDNASFEALIISFIETQVLKYKMPDVVDAA